MFLDSDERLLLLHQPANPMTPESLRGFRRAGIRTSICSNWASWHELEPSPGVYYWDTLDQVVESTISAGLKALIPLYFHPATWVPCIHYKIEGIQAAPDDFWGLPWFAADTFDPDAMEAEREFLHRACERYTTDGVACFYSMHVAGERIVPPTRPDLLGEGHPAHANYAYTEQQIVDIVLARQRVFAQYSDELWNAFHAATVHDGTGNEHLWTCFEVLKQEFPAHTINRLIYTFFSLGCEGHQADIEGVKHWVGAEFCTNVVRNAGRIDPLGVWGLIMGPSHYELSPGQPAPGAFEAVAEAIEILNG